MYIFKATIEQTMNSPINPLVKKGASASFLAPSFKIRRKNISAVSTPQNHYTLRRKSAHKALDHDMNKDIAPFMGRRKTIRTQNIHKRKELTYTNPKNSQRHRKDKPLEIEIEGDRLELNSKLSDRASCPNQRPKTAIGNLDKGKPSYKILNIKTLPKKYCKKKKMAKTQFARSPKATLVPFESKFFGKKHKNVELVSTTVTQKKPKKRASIVFEEEKKLQCVDQYYSVVKTGNTRYKKKSSSQVFQPNYLRKSCSTMNLGKDKVKEKLCDRDSLKILMRSETSINSGNPKHKNCDIQLQKAIKPCSNQRRSRQETHSSPKKFILNPNLGLREIILDPTRSSKVEPRLQNSQKDKLLSRIDILKYCKRLQLKLLNRASEKERKVISSRRNKNAKVL
ncbi:unnamed protein product [Moneuplotes crassus]|uniref:Uncharacterized protein n=1 Tax=Euplotes crassus TaxID=5936 RepID=A0AAD1XDB2_EUPCR|nr:unnamed protein product [Moneuplotes crassus]